MQIGPGTISVVVADDHHLFRSAVLDRLSAEPRLRILAEAEDGASALNSILKHSPQVAVLDLAMPGLSGLEVVRALRRTTCPTEVVLLTIHNDAHIVRSAVDLGVCSYVLKEDLDTHLLSAVEAAAERRPYFSPTLPISGIPLSVHTHATL